MEAELRAVALFSDLTDADLSRLAQGAELVNLESGRVLFSEGDEGHQAYVVTGGEVEILKITDGREVLLARRGPGDVIGEMALLDAAPRMATVRACSDTTLISLEKDRLDELLASSATAARSLFSVLLERWRQTEAQLRQKERMVQLGTLTAGLAHEMNNPAAAVVRGSAQLQQSLEAYAVTVRSIAGLDLDNDMLLQVDTLLRDAQGEPPLLGTLQRSDNEAGIEDVLDSHGLEEAWDLADQLASSGKTPADVKTILDRLGDHAVPVLRAVAATQSIYGLAGEVNEGASRLSAIVGALKSYSHLDQAPIQQVDVRKGLSDTLLILKSKLDDIGVEKHFEEVPEIAAFGSELNQVWTNLIDNAADAVRSSGRSDGLVLLRVSSSGDAVVVEVEDNGDGIPPEVIPRIFDAFFTTKPPGSGAGLGLDISYAIVVHKHRGSIDVDSVPGRTVFTVTLPIDGAQT